MDEQEMIRFLRSELYQAMERDPELRAALKHIDAGKGTFQDTAQYSERTSELLGQILSKHVDELPEGMRETVCKALLRERYEEVNGICAEVQEQLDAQNGIRLQPQRAPYPAERVQQVAHALEDPTVALSVIQRRAKAPVANVSKSFHDDYIRENAEVRSRLGFKCYLNRIAATGCCKWCTDIAGRYVYGDHPDEVFHRHDNCGCTVTYENGRERQDVWSKRKWQEDPAEVEANGFEPVVNSQERAREIEENGLRGLTKPGQGDIMGLKDVKPMIRAIEQPIEQQHTGKGNPNAILTFDVPLTNRQASLLEQLQEFDSRVVVPKGAVNMSDLAALTAKTGHEFAMFTRKQERLIIRGNSVKVNITIDDAKELAKSGYRWSGHTHPGDSLNCLMPSGGDKLVLMQFPQSSSVIYNSKGQFATFDKG